MSTRQRINDHERQLVYCTYCPRLCRFACPVAEAERRETLTPTWKMTLLYMVQRNRLDLDRETVEPWFRCTGCGLHSMPCEHRIEIFPAMQEARTLAAEVNLVPEPLRSLAAGIEGAEAELQAIARSVLPDAPHTGEAAFIPGAHALREAPELVRHVWNVLNRLLPAPPALWAGPQDLGISLMAAGQRSALQHRAERVAAAAVAAGQRRLWVLNPEEAWVLRAVYPELGVDVEAEVRLPLEAADKLLPHDWRKQAAGVADKGEGPTFTYHDPCYLGRRLGITDAPRRVLEQLTGAPPVEPPWSREWGWCCGGGQSYAELDPEAAGAVARRRAAQLSETGARTVVTACSRCRSQLRQAFADSDVRVVDLLELIEI